MAAFRVSRAPWLRNLHALGELRHRSKTMNNPKYLHRFARTASQTITHANSSHHIQKRTHRYTLPATTTDSYRKLAHHQLPRLQTPTRLQRPPTSLQRNTPAAPRALHSASKLNMASDEDYASFLDKANQPTGGASTQSTHRVGTKSTNTTVPSSLQNIQEYYTSDADEPFEPVSLTYGKSSISARELKELLGHGEEVTDLGVEGLGGYEGVVKAVRKAGNGEVGVFRVVLGGTRSEVWVVSVDEEGGKLVGVKALAVES